MYNVQRQDALTDWNNINQYNSPEEQMKRLKNAGLNPNLVYDNGATTTAAPVRSSDTGSWHPQAPDYSGIGNAASAGISAYYDTQVKNQQIENLKTSNAVMEADKALKEAQAINLGASTSKSLFDLDMGKTLASTTIEAAKANLQKILADTENTQTGTSQTRQNMALALSANERAEIKQGMDLKEAAVRILKMRQDIASSPLQRAQIQAQIDNVNQDTRIKKLSENLKSLGIESSDNFFYQSSWSIVRW